MSATVCWRCGRERGRNMYRCEADASALGESACFAMAFARAERERDAARRELADAKAEVERLMRERDAANEEAGEAWEHVCKIDAVNARLRRDVQDAQARLAELESASATARGAQVEEPSGQSAATMAHRTDEELESMWDHADGGVAGSNRALYELGRADARREVDELRRVLGCTPGETMLEAAKRMRAEADDARKWSHHWLEVAKRHQTTDEEYPGELRAALGAHPVDNVVRVARRLFASDCALHKVERILEEAIGTGPWGSAVMMAERVRDDMSRLRGEVSDLLAERDGYSAACTMSLRQLAAEADELRRLAWEWCITARRWSNGVAKLTEDLVEAFNECDALHAEADGLRAMAWGWCLRAAEEDERAGGWADECYAAMRERDALRAEVNALRATLAAKNEPPPKPAPIESLGPVPVRAGEVGDMDDGYRAVGEVRVTRALARLIRDAVRRGARLEEP